MTNNITFEKQLVIRLIGLSIASLAMLYLCFLMPETSRLREYIGFYNLTLVNIGIAIFGLIAILFKETNKREKIKSKILRGRQLIPFKEAEKKARKLRKKEDSGLTFGFLQLPFSAASSHFAFVGSTGSGKTISMRLLMQSVLPEIRPGSDHRAIIFDAKQEILPILAGLNLECNIFTLNPFDERCVAWDIAADVTTPATAQQVASILVPIPQNSSQRFFEDAARDILSGVMISFIENSPYRWTFQDVMLALRDAKLIEKIVKRSIQTESRLSYFQGEKSFADILSTVRTILSKYEVVAACWAKASAKLSLIKWLDTESILILGNDESVREPLDNINKVIFKRLSELVLAQKGSEQRRTWIYLDELREAGKLDGLTSLLNKGRSNGACLVLGFQDIEGLRSLYTREGANEILSQCANKAILRIDSPETAEWASKLFGEFEVLDEKEGISRQEKGRSKSVNFDLTKRQSVLPAEILSLMPTTKDNGLSGYYLVPSIGGYKVTVSGDWISDKLMPQDSEVLGFKPVSAASQYLTSWNDVDLQRLKLQGEGEWD